MARPTEANQVLQRVRLHRVVELSDRERYDAIRIKYPGHSDDRFTAVETALREQEMLHALRAFDRGTSISEEVRRWHNSAERALGGLTDYIQKHRRDEQYHFTLLLDDEQRFRDRYEHASRLKASFSNLFRGNLIKLLRKGHPQDPLPFRNYLDQIAEADAVFREWEPVILTEPFLDES